MPNFYLPDVMMARAAKRLRAMADAIDAGEHLTDIAAKFRIPIRALRRVAAPRPRKPPKHKRPAITQITLARAAKRIRDGGVTYRELAAELNVKVTTLIKALTKMGVTTRQVKKGKMAQAIELYRANVKLSEIHERTGVPTMTLYARLRQLDSVTRRPHRVRPKAAEPETIARLCQAAELYHQGVKLKDIAARTGVVAARLYAHLEKNGGYTPRRLLSSGQTKGRETDQR